MVSVFHGDNSSVSYHAAQEQLARLKATSPQSEVLTLRGASVTQTDLIEALEASSLFASNRIIYIDGLLSRRPSKEKDRLIEYLQHSLISLRSPSAFFDLLLWEGKPVTAATLKKLGTQNVRAQEFKLGKTIWKFLDALKPKNVRFLLPLFESTVKTEPVELVMFWIVRRVGELFLAKSLRTHAMDSIKTEWQQGNLKRQAEAWTEEQLVKFHEHLMEIDEMVKTGGSPADLRTHLDILLSSL